MYVCSSPNFSMIQTQSLVAPASTEPKMPEIFDLFEKPMICPTHITKFWNNPSILLDGVQLPHLS